VVREYAKFACRAWRSGFVYILVEKETFWSDNAKTESVCHILTRSR
jgi:hypothetical protein